MLVRKKLPALLFVSILAVLAAALVAGCGGGGSSSGGGGDPATLMPASAPVYIEGTLSPSGDESAALDELADAVAGVDNLGEYIAVTLEEATIGNEKFDFEEEVKPWVGEKAGMFLADYDGHDFQSYGGVLETTNSDEAEAFIEKHGEDGAEEGEFEGHKYWVSTDDESVLGVLEDWLVIGKSKADFEAMVKASEGDENLAAATKFTAAAEGALDEGVGHLYVDIGGLLDETHALIDQETELGFSLMGIEPHGATLFASAIPHTGQLEIDMDSNLTTTQTGGDASALLESLPATATGAFATAEFGKSLGESLHALSENGIPGQLAPGELEGAFGQLGIDNGALAKAFGNVAAYVEGSSKEDLGGAAVIQAKDPNEARDLVTKVGLVLRASKTPGVTALGGELTGFSIRSADIGSQPLIIGTAGEKVVIAYGAKGAAQALAQKGPTLGSTDDFKAAKGSLGQTPIAAFVTGPPALELVESLLSPEQHESFESARPYLQKIAYLGAGSETVGKRTEAKLIIGVHK